MNDYRIAPAFMPGKFVATSDSCVERLPRNRYVVLATLRSRIDPSCIVKEEVGARCPRCNANVEKLDHGKRVTCSQCSLHMVAFGNALLVSENAQNLGVASLWFRP
jgi:ribosomal protein S27AE